MTPDRLRNFGRHLVAPVVTGVVVAVVIFGLYVSWQEGQSPTQLDGKAGNKLSDLPPFIEDGYVKIPYDRDRTRECLTQSTFSLVRKSAYAPPLGAREDDLTIGLRNNPIAGLGFAHKLLWFPIGAVPAGDWEVVFAAGRDCGGLWHPGMSETGPVPLGQVHLPVQP